MKIMMSALVALSVLAGIASTASASPDPWAPRNDPANSIY
jgi:hypothetical protein